MEKERGVVLEEIHMYDDDGDSLSSDLVSKIFFGEDNSLSRPILGTAKTVKKLSRKDILDFRKRWYRPENMVLSFVGNVDEDVFFGYVEKYFCARMEKQKTPFLPFSGDEETPSSVYATIKKPYEQASVSMRFRSPAIGREKYYAPFILANMLGGGMSSRLFQKIREEMGLVYEIYSTNVARERGGNFDICFATSPKNAQKAVAAIADVVKDILAEGFSEKEILKTRNQYETSMVLSDESAFDQMRAMGKEVLVKGVLTSTESQIKEMLSVTAEDIERVARSVLDDSVLSVAYVGKQIDRDLLRVYRGQ